MTDHSPRTTLALWPRWWPLVALLCALGPFAVGAHRLLYLYWFGDDWDLLKQIHDQGFGSWIWSVFAEIFVPVFKVAWGGLVYLGGFLRGHDRSPLVIPRRGDHPAGLRSAPGRLQFRLVVLWVPSPFLCGTCCVMIWVAH